MYMHEQLVRPASCEVVLSGENTLYGWQLSSCAKPAASNLGTTV